MLNNRSIIFFLLFIFSYTELSGKDSTHFVYIGTQAHYGFIIPHSQAIKDISHTRPLGFEISRNKLRTSFKDWQVLNAYWISGFEARYFNYQNPDILGGVFDLSIFAEPVAWHWRKFLFTIRGGAGVSYHTKIYDEVENPLNQFFSSRISFPLFVDIRFKYRVSNYTFLTLAGCYNHISNGGFKLPNKGMNFPTLALGMEFYRQAFPDLYHNYSSVVQRNKPGALWIFQTLTSIKVLSASGDLPEKPALIYGFHTRVSKPLGPFYAVNGGAEIIFDGYIKETIRREGAGIDYKRFALTFGQDFMLGRMFITQYLGAYLYSPYKAGNAIYQKYEVAYKFPPRLMVGVYLKSHLQVAELMGVSLNYIIKGRL